MIPNRLHFIFGLTPDFGGKPFSFCHWAAIRSAQVKNPEWKTTVWVGYEPTGRYWEAIKPYITVRKIVAPNEVFGNPIPHPAHKCDWLRLSVLYESGGVYLDLDTITIKPFTHWLDESPGSMVVETANGVTVGLCNGLIAAEPEADFIGRWVDKFRNFRSTGHDAYWNESAVKWPHQVWLEGPNFHTLRPQTFMIPDWTSDGISAMFERDERFPLAIGHHLWESFSWPHLSTYEAENFHEKKCTYSRLLEEVLGDTIRAELL